MQPLPLVEHLDELKHLRLGLLSRVILPLMHHLILERTEEALDDGIVIAVPLAAHAGHLPGLRQQPQVGHAGIQRTLIGVMDQAGLRLPMGQGHPQGLEGDLLIGLGTHGPANDPPLSTLVKLAKALRVSVAELLKLTP